MRILLFTALLVFSSCATRYILPGNRFMTPETNGGFMRGQAELQQTNANQLLARTGEGSVKDGVLYSDVDRTAYLLSLSFFDQLDFFWTHTGSANSLVGAKAQIMGGSRTSNATGHKMAISAAVGGNDHEPEDKSIDFNLGGREFGYHYGYRLNPIVMPYSSLMYSSWDFDGKIKKGTNAGLRPQYRTDILAANVGAQIDFNWFFGKLECSYQRLTTANSKDHNRFIFGYSLGVSW